MIRGVTTALYGWMERFARDGVEWDWDALYGACAESGVDAVETDAEPHKVAVARRLGLAVSSSYIGLPLHLPWEHLDTARTVLPIAQRLAAAGGTDLILNGTLERLPELRIGIVELSAIWVPMFLMMLDGGTEFTTRLNGRPVYPLPKRPSEYFRRQVRVSSFSYELPGRLIGQTTVGGVPAVVPTITGRAWITGIGQYMLDPSDPYPTGFAF